MSEKKAAKKASKTPNPPAKTAAAQSSPRGDKPGGEASVLAKIDAMPIVRKAAS